MNEIKALSLCCLLFLMISCGAGNSLVKAQKNQKNNLVKSEKLILLELFTSEGCSSCPPADKTLAFLEEHQPIAGVEVVTLSYHVNYWDYIGWKDIYAQELFTQRQNQYAQRFNLNSIYTPQMIVDGKAELVGSNTGKAAKVIADFIKEEKAQVEIFRDKEKLSLKITNLPKHEDATVFFAIAENNLNSNIKKGENAGLNLQHQSVVRELKSVASIPTNKNSLETEVLFQIKSEWKKENLKIVVFVQENTEQKILGLSQLKN